MRAEHRSKTALHWRRLRLHMSKTSREGRSTIFKQTNKQTNRNKGKWTQYKQAQLRQITDNISSEKLSLTFSFVSWSPHYLTRYVALVALQMHVKKTFLPVFDRYPYLTFTCECFMFLTKCP